MLSSNVEVFFVLLLTGCTTNMANYKSECALISEQELILKVEIIDFRPLIDCVEEPCSFDEATSFDYFKLKVLEPKRFEGKVLGIKKYLIEKNMIT